MTEFEIGYLMGLVVGEGCFTGDCHQYYLTIKLHENDIQPLLTIRSLLGGKIYGPYDRDGRQFWVYRILGREIRAHLHLFYENLPESRNRDQFLAWAQKWNIDFWDT